MPLRDNEGRELTATATPGVTRVIDLEPPATQADIRFCHDNDISIHPDPDAPILMAQGQWDHWNREFDRVTFTSGASGTAGNVWLFENNANTDFGITSSNSTSNTVVLDPNTFSTDSIEIRGDLRIVTNNGIPWNPGVVLPYDAPSIPADQFRPGLRTPRLTAAQRERRHKSNAAWLRAEQLLRKYLSREQRRELVVEGRFHVQSGDRRYRISKGRIGNVEWVDREGDVLQRYCCHVRDMVPTYDNLLAQMLLLIHDERRFIETANIHWRRDKIKHPFEIKRHGMFDNIAVWDAPAVIAA